LAVRCAVEKSHPSSNVKVKVQRSRSPGTKRQKTAESSPLTMHSKACAVRCTQQQTTPLRRSRGRGDRVTAVHADGVCAGRKISACCLF